jgi:hypothetical protein
MRLNNIIKVRTLISLLLLISSSKLKSQILTSAIIDKYSLSSLYVVAQNNDIRLWNASGFFMLIKSNIYFVTNNHVVGEEYYIDEFTRLHGKTPSIDSFPNYLKVRIYNTYAGRFSWLRIDLKDSSKKSNVIKFWENENKKEGLLDVVAIKMERAKTDFSGSTVVDSTALANDLALYPSEDLFVVGFPLNFGESILYPFWKRATIASDPNLNDAGISQFWIDATTRGGMSGSPVFFRGTSIPTKGGGIGFSPNPATYLIGIYSAQNIDGELGLITRLEKIFNKLYTNSN